MGKYNCRKTFRWLLREKGINLRERLEKIVLQRGFINSIMELQHGDCRLQHNFNGTFCDLEDFGRYPWYRDLVTYTSEEIVTPSVSELPALLAHYFVHRWAYLSPQPPVTRQNAADAAFQKLEEIEAGQNPERLNKLIREEIGISIFADFLVGCLAGMIEEDIIINGARKKPSREYLDRLLPHYPNYSLEKLQSSRMKHIQKLYSLLTSPDAGYFFQHCSNQEQVMDYFFQMGQLLNDLGLTKIERLVELEPLSKGSQYRFFFAQGLDRGRESYGDKKSA